MERKGPNHIENSGAYQEFAEPDATQKMYEELNKMGSIEDTVNVEVKSVAEAEQGEDAKALGANEVELGRELKEVEIVLALIDDITEHKGLDLWMTLRFIEESILIDKEEVAELAEKLVESGSSRFKNGQDVRNFGAMLRTWRERKLLAPGMTLAQARETLLEQKEQDTYLLNRKHDLANRPDKTGTA